MKRWLSLRVWLWLALAATAGCASTGFVDKGFVAKDAGYRIAYGDKPFRLVSSPWVLENYFAGNQGLPNGEKQAGIYRASMDWVKPDGDTVRVDYLPYDLKFRHGNGSIIVVATVAVPQHLRALRLSAVAEEWAKSYSGLQFSFKSGTGQRSASKIVQSKTRIVGGRPAREITFDVVDVDQLQLDADAPRTRIRIVFVSAPLYKQFLSPEMVSPAFLFVGYTSDEHRFDQGVRDYDDLLERISFPTAASPADEAEPD